MWDSNGPCVASYAYLLFPMFSAFSPSDFPICLPCWRRPSSDSPSDHVGFQWSLRCFLCRPFVSHFPLSPSAFPSARPGLGHPQTPLQAMWDSSGTCVLSFACLCFLFVPLSPFAFPSACLAGLGHLQTLLQAMWDSSGPCVLLFAYLLFRIFRFPPWLSLLPVLLA